ncbi:MAG: 30S ribosomal protein S20 [Streptococcaceae bacterium]|jgi:small subunit ribosomal protein S20|nr:30S ribosomal protein S20 [Streptococcaceae bacterium]MCH4177626.1 30S ribosomal protein S20 [Streptococcaceae bacterium]
MPNIKSAIKRAETNETANLRNSAQKTALRSAIKKFETAVAEGSADAAELYKAATKAIDQAETKGLIHKNKASRDKSRLAAKLAK